MKLNIHHRIGKTLSIAFLSILLVVCATRIVPRVWVYHHPHNPTLSTIASRSQGGESHEHRVSSPNDFCDRSRDRRDPPYTLCHVHSPSPCTPSHSNFPLPIHLHLPTSPSTTPCSTARDVPSLSLVSQSMFHGFSTLNQRHHRFPPTQHLSSLHTQNHPRHQDAVVIEEVRFSRTSQATHPSAETAHAALNRIGGSHHQVVVPARVHE